MPRIIPCGPPIQKDPTTGHLYVDLDGPLLPGQALELANMAGGPSHGHVIHRWWGKGVPTCSIAPYSVTIFLYKALKPGQHLEVRRRGRRAYPVFVWPIRKV